MNKNETAMREGEHLSADMLAVMAEEGRAAADTRSLEHLARCRNCMAAYADAVRYRTAWLGSPELFEEKAWDTAPARPDRALRGFRLLAAAPRAVQVLAAAAVVIAVGIVSWALARRAAPTPAPSGAIAALLEHASGADLVLPGGERGAAKPALAYREGSAEDSASREAIEALRLRYEQGARRAPDLYILAAALTASGRTDLAYDYVQEGRKLAPRHTGFIVLEAALVRREGNFDRADQLLRQARVYAPDDLTLMLDHAIVLEELGDTTEATDLLRRVISSAPRSPLAQRAEQRLASFARH